MPAVSTQLNDFIMPGVSSAAAKPVNSVSLFTRVVNAFVDARSRQAEREVARMISLRGGRLTDDLERQIERHFV
jgi:hypothetical protein